MFIYGLQNRAKTGQIFARERYKQNRIEYSIIPSKKGKFPHMLTISIIIHPTHLSSPPPTSDGGAQRERSSFHSSQYPTNWIFPHLTNKRTVQWMVLQLIHSMLSIVLILNVILPSDEELIQKQWESINSPRVSHSFQLTLSLKGIKIFFFCSFYPSPPLILCKIW